MPTTLSAGDVAFLSLIADNPDTFSFVLLKDIDSGTIINVTDNGWLSTGSLSINEGVLQYVAPSALTVGTVITYVANSSSNGPDVGSSSGWTNISGGTNFALSTSGDSLIAFQGTLTGTGSSTTSTSPTLLAALTIYRSSFDANAANSNTTALPTGLTVGTNAVAVGKLTAEWDDSRYTGLTTFASVAAARTAINTASNWTGSDTDTTNFTGTFTINPTVTIAATDSVAAEALLDPGTFRITRASGSTTNSLSVNYTVSGTATNGTDYTMLTGTATIAAAASFVDITITPVDDTTVEGNETVTLTLTNNANYTLGASGTEIATVTIADNDPTVNLSVSSNAGTEAGTTAITVTATASSAVSGNQTVNLAVTGTGITTGDYTLSNSTITIPSGATSGSVTFTVVDDTLVEGTETATLTISNPSSGITLGSTTTQNITITDNDVAANPTVNLSVSSNTGTEAGTTAITVTATASSAVSGNQTVNLGVSGTGITAGDYNLSNSTITIPNGATSGSVTFTVVDDTLVEGTETATLTISNPSSGITLGSTTTQNITITDNDFPTVNLSVSSNTGTEAGTTAITVTATASSAVSGNQTVNLGISGTGITTGDYNLSSSVITISNGSTTGSVTFTVVDDFLIEVTETAILIINTPSSGIVLGNTTSQNITITDNDVAPPIVITEVDPSGSSKTYSADWFELTNTGTTDVTITGWKIDDDSNLFTSAVALRGITTIPAGKSAIFLEGDATGTTDATILANFSTAWFGTSTPPSGLLFGAYGGSNVGLSANNGDAVNIFDANGNKITSVNFGAADTNNPAATFDNKAGLTNTNISTLSVGGTNGAFLSANGSETGSPGSNNPAIFITEVDPSGGGTTYNADWFELTNTGFGSVDITGWKIDDDSNSFASAVALNGVTSIAAGQSVIFIEGGNTEVNAFKSAWFGGTVPSGFTIGTYSGSGVSFDNAGDAVNIFNANGTKITSVTFGAATASATFDNKAGLGTVSTLSAVGVNGAFSNSTEIGSPGTTSAAVTSIAPTIQETTSTTLVNLATTGSGSVSGIISDPTDPAKTLGIDFAIADADTPVGNLTVTATSNNTSVVPNGNLTLSGSGATRNLKINPTGVGYANITVSVSDGTNSNSYTINYAASAASTTPSASRFLTGASNASTAISIDSNYMLVGDDENQVLRLYDRNNSGLPVNGFDFTTSLGLTEAGQEVDIEAATKVGSRIFWMGSESNDNGSVTRPNRNRVFGTDISGTGASTTLAYVGRYDFLKQDIIAWDVNNGHGKGANYYGLSTSAAPGADPKLNTGYNIEGLEMAPDNTTAYVAFRAPQEPTTNRTKALIVPVTNFTTLLSASGGGTQGTAQFGAPIELDLGGRGIREIRKNAANQYVIIAGAAGDTGAAPNDFRLYTWTGVPTDAAILRSVDLTSLGIAGSFESIVSVPDNLTSTSQLQLLVDDGNTVFYNDGKAAKDVTPNFQKSRSEVVTLGSPIYTLPVGAISLNSLYSQNFDTLINTSSGTWTDNSTILGWYTSRTGTGTTIAASDGSSTGGNLYSFGSTGSTDRALGSIGSGNTAAGSFFWGGRFFNDTGNTISTLYVNYVGEEWRNSAAAAQTVDFQYQIGATGLTTGTWSDFNSLDFTSPTTGGTAGAVNGNLSQNRTSISDAITGLSLNPGQEIWLRWSDPDHIGNDHGLAIDDLKVSTSPFPGVSIVQSDGNTAVTEGGATDTYTIVLTTQPTTNVTITLTPDSQVTASATTLTFTTVNWNIAQTVTVTAVDDILVEGTHSGVISHSATSTDANYNGITIPSVTATITDNDFPSTITKISAIQGSGSTAALSGVQTIEGIVTRKFSALNGFYVQEEDADTDNNPATSEAIFIYDPAGLFTGNVADKVRITGTVNEYTSGTASSLTQLTSLTNVTNLGASTLPTVTNIQLPVTSVSDLERYEGMLVNISATSGDLTVTEYYQLEQYGQILLAATGSSNQPGTDARLDQYTQFNSPSVSGYAAYLADIAKRQIYLDDGNGSSYPDPIIFGRAGNPLSASNTIRGGDTVTSITGILDQRLEGYRIQTTTGVNFTPTNPRPVTPPVVGGTLKAANFNVLNFFNDLNTGSSITTNGVTFVPRGANNTTEFNRQRDKIIQAIITSGADVLGLNEVENNGFGANSAIQNLVNGLNAVAGAGTYAFINPGTSISTDAITVGIIYKTGKVIPVGSAATMALGYSAAFDLVGRRPLAQTFQQISTGEVFTAVVNHFKSKGSSAGGVGDADINDGQGASNGTRTRQAQDLATWLATKPTGTLDADYLILGDLNSYAKEDPITTLANAGYNNLLPITSYSYVFSGQVGSLDHALGSASLGAQVAGAEKWHINADEPDALDYNTENKTAGQISSLYSADPFRASDHDPVIVGLNLYTKQNPTDISLTSSSVNENVTIGTLVGNFNTIDPNVTDTFIYSLVDGTNYADNAAFQIVGNQLQSNSSLNYEAKNSYSIRVRTTDQSGLSFDKQLTIGVINVNEAPIVSNAIASQSVDTNANFVFALPNNIFTDPEGDNLNYNANTPAWLNFNFTTKTFTGTAPNTVGTNAITVQVNDGNGNTTSTNFNIFVKAATVVGNVSNGTNTTFDYSSNTVGISIVTGDIAETIKGGSGADKIQGAGGNDIIFGNAGNDRLYGEAGDDILYGGLGTDNLWGGLGSDTFVLQAGQGLDIANDFLQGTDKLGLSGGLTFGANNTTTDVTFALFGTATKVFAPGGVELMRLLNFAGTLTASDFTTVV